MRTACVVVVVTAGFAVSAFGQATFVSQSRQLFPGGTPSPAGFGQWDGSSHQDVAEGGAFVGASQSSNLTITGATFNLFGEGNDGGGSTTLDFVFTVPAGVTFTLIGSTNFNQGPPYGINGGGHMTFTGPGVDIAAPDFGIFTTTPWNYSGTLSGGTYTLHVEAHGGGGFQQGGYRYGSGRVEGSLVLVPTPGAAVLGLVGLAALRRRR